MYIRVKIESTFESRRDIYIIYNSVQFEDKYIRVNISFTGLKLIFAHIARVMCKIASLSGAKYENACE